MSSCKSTSNDNIVGLWCSGGLETGKLLVQFLVMSVCQPWARHLDTGGN